MKMKMKTKGSRSSKKETLDVKRVQNEVRIANWLQRVMLRKMEANRSKGSWSRRKIPTYLIESAKQFGLAVNAILSGNRSEAIQHVGNMANYFMFAVDVMENRF